MMADEEVEKWRVPVMDADPSRVVRHREQNEASIPTAEDLDQWRMQAEEEGYQQGLVRARQETRELQQQLLQLIDFFEHPLQALNEDIEHQLTPAGGNPGAATCAARAQGGTRRNYRFDSGLGTVAAGQSA